MSGPPPNRNSPPQGPPPPGGVGRARGRAAPPPAGGPPPAPGSRPGPPPTAGQARPPSAMGGRGMLVQRPGPTSGTAPLPPGSAPPPGSAASRGRAGVPQQQPPGTSRPGPPVAAMGRAVQRGKTGDTMLPGAAARTTGSTESSKSSSDPPTVAGGGSSPTTGTAGGGDTATIISKLSSTVLSPSTDHSGSVGRGNTRGGRRDRGSVIPVTRPAAVMETKKGTSGDVCKIQSNYFKLLRKTDWTLLQYRVDFSIEEDRTFEKKRMVKVHADKLGAYIFDGSMLFSVSRYTPDASPLILTSAGSDGKPVNIQVKLVGDVGPTEFSYMQFFNIMLRKVMENLKLQPLGRNYYDPQAKILLKDFKLELWPGYVTSIRQHENDVLLCAEVSTKILRMDTVYDQLMAARKTSPQNIQTEAAKLLLGAIVITRYNNKTYRVDEIFWNQNPQKTFPKKDGTNTNFIEYYKSRYGITIKDINQPLIGSMPRDRDRRAGQDGPVLLVPELCNMTGLSNEQRENFKLMKAVADFTRTGPPKRIESLMSFAKRVTTTSEINKEFKDWQLSIENKLVNIDGRTHKPEEILQGQNRKCSYQVENADWGNAFRDFKLFNTTTCAKWAVIFPTMVGEETKQFVQALQKVSGPMGFKMANPLQVPLQKATTAAYVTEVNKLADQGPQMIMVVIPNNKGDAYHAIKKICCVDKPVPTQCVTGTVLKKPKGMMSVATKVAIQMASKLGAEPWAVTMPLKDTMVIGYDSYHDSTQKGMAVGAVIASLNTTMTRYSSSCTFHHNNEELISQMKVCFINAIRKYNEENKKFPTRIIVYRDGVGDGQIEFVREHEITAMKQVFSELKFDPKFTYIVVSKRINTKFFRTGGREATNPPSGTVIDDVVTLPERYDFFLISQSVRQGTVNPTSYNVIEDNSGLRPDHIQKLTYKLTHLYYNWPGTVRVPAPCQYAHKLAFLVGNSIHKKPSANLETLLYYL